MNLLENMKKAGCSEEEIRKVAENPEFNTFEEIISGSDSFDEALEKLKETYPNLDVAEVKKVAEEQAGQRTADADSDEVTDLDEDALEAVAGGSFQFGMNWKTGLGLALGGIAGAALAYAFTRKEKTQNVSGSSATGGNSERTNDNSSVF